MALRAFQAELVARVGAEYADGARSVVMQCPTGGGKTHTAAEVIRRSVAKGNRVAFLAHLDALVEDTADRLGAAGIHVGFVQAGRPSSPDAPVQVASLATLHARGERPPADFVILDECHRAMGPTVRAILEAYAGARILGLTATPERGDGQPLGDVFDRLVVGPSVRALQRDGHLVPIDLVSPKGEITRGLAMDPVEGYQRWANGKRAIVFASSIAHAEALAARFVDLGVPVGVFTEKTTRDQRRMLRGGLASGDLRVLISVNALVEGFDVPAIECVVLARAFTVAGSFLQAIGRGSRPSPATGKTRCVVLDLRGAFIAHGLPDEDRRWSLEGKAVARVETIPALARCKECLAVFRPSGRCPRCDAPVSVTARIPRVLSRAEKIVNVSALPQHERDRLYLGGLWQRVKHVPKLARLSAYVQKDWVMQQFRKRFGRDPTEVPARQEAHR